MASDCHKRIEADCLEEKSTIFSNCPTRFCHCRYFVLSTIFNILLILRSPQKARPSSMAGNDTPFGAVAKAGNTIAGRPDSWRCWNKSWSALLPHRNLRKFSCWALHPKCDDKSSINVFFQYLLDLMIISNFIIPLSPFSQRFSSIGAKLLANRWKILSICQPLKV